MSELLRVLIIRNAYQRDTGGAEQYAFNLALALKRAGHTPIVITKHDAIHNKCKTESIESIEGKWHESQEWTRLYYLRYLLTSLWYAWIILRYRIRIVHPQSRDDFVFATRAARWLHRKIVWTDHADLKYAMDRVNHFHPRMQSWLITAAKYSSDIIVVSKSEKQEINKVFPEINAKLVVVHNGVFKPENVIPIDKRHRFVIGTNARLVPAKGISELLSAFTTNVKGGDKLELWLLGGFSGNRERYYNESKKLGIAKHVKFIGYVPNPNDYVASMDIFVHASYHEAFSLAIVEACALGKAIVATNVGGTPEIINNKTGILVPPKEVTSLGYAISRLIEDPELREKLALNARERAFKDFDFQKIVEEKIIPIYVRGSG